MLQRYSWVTVVADLEVHRRFHALKTAARTWRAYMGCAVGTDERTFTAAKQAFIRGDVAD